MLFRSQLNVQVNITQALDRAYQRMNARTSNVRLVEQTSDHISIVDPRARLLAHVPRTPVLDDAEILDADTEIDDEVAQ